MKKLVVLLSLITLGFSSINAFAQGGPDQRFLNAGVGLSGWGIPVYANYEFPIANDITMSLGGSFQSKSENIFFGPTQKIGWRHTIIGLQAAGMYYFDNLIDLPSDFDLYAGLQFEYFIWNSRVVSGSFPGAEYSGSGAGGIGFSGLAGVRYHVKPSKLSLNFQVAGGSVMSSARLGVSFWL